MAQSTGLCAAASLQQLYLALFRVFEAGTLAEAQNEVAWRTGVWQEHTDGASRVAAEGGFHASIVNALKVLPAVPLLDLCLQHNCSFASQLLAVPATPPSSAADYLYADLQVGPRMALSGANQIVQVSRAGSLAGHCSGRGGGLPEGSERLVSPGGAVHSWRRQREHGQDQSWSGSAADAGPAGSCLDHEGWQAAEPACAAPRSGLSPAGHCDPGHSGVWLPGLVLCSLVPGAEQGKPGREDSAMFFQNALLKAGVGAEGASSRPSSSSVPGTAAGDAALSYWQSLGSAAGDRHSQSSCMPDMVHSAPPSCQAACIKSAKFASQAQAHSRSSDMAGAEQAPRAGMSWQSRC